MYQGTTPEFSFTLPFNVDEIESLLITFRQFDKVLDFTEEDVEVEGNIIFIRLTQEQTSKFDSHFKCKVQIKVKLQDDTIVVSQIENVDINQSLSSRVL